MTYIAVIRFYPNSRDKLAHDLISYTTSLCHFRSKKEGGIRGHVGRRLHSLGGRVREVRDVKRDAVHSKLRPISTMMQIESRNVGGKSWEKYPT